MTADITAFPISVVKRSELVSASSVASGDSFSILQSGINKEVAAEVIRDYILTPLVNVQTGSSYTLVLSDAWKLVIMDNASANTLEVPPNSSAAFPIGVRIDVGQTTIVVGSGVTIRTPETLKIRKKWGKITLFKRDTNVWDVEGNLEAAP